MPNTLSGMFGSMPLAIQGYEAARQSNQAQGMNELAQASGAMGLLAKIRAEQMDMAFKAEMAKLGPNPSAEQLGALAAKYGGPEGVMRHADRQATAANTREMAMARLQQAAQQYESTYQLRAAAAKTPQERLELDRQKEAFKQGLQREAQRIAGERANYDFGFTPGPSIAPTVATSPQGGLPTNVPPSDAAALAAAEIPGGSGTVNRVMPPQEVAGMQMQPGGALQGVTPPQTPPVAAPTATPIPARPNNLDARDLGAGARGPVMGTTPLSVASIAPQGQASPPMPPEIASAPKKVQDQWKLAMAKQVMPTGAAADAVVDAIIAGRMQIPSGWALRSPYWQDVIARVAQKDPNFDATKYGARAATRRTFASGPEARNVTALNTVIGHLGTLDEAAQALENRDVTAFNAVKNRMARELGRPEIVNFETARLAVAEETMRVFRQVGASEVEARHWADTIKSSGSPTQLRGTIKTLGDLLDSRIQAISAQYERSINPDRNPAQVEPRNLEVLDRLRRGGAGVSQRYSDSEKERRYQEWKAQQGK